MQRITRRSCSNSIALKSQEAMGILRGIHRNKLSNKQSNLENVHKAFRIYNQVNGHRDHIIVNSFISICLHFQCADEVALIWDDVQAQFENISLVKLLKCCLHSD